MDEVKTMSRAGENVGKAVGTSVRGARHGAKRASEVGLAVSKQAAARADQELADRGVSTTELQDQLARRTTGMSRRELAKRSRKMRKRWNKRSKQSRKQLSKNTETARKELAARIDPSAGKRRRWPWVVLGTLVLAGGVAVAMTLARQPEEVAISSYYDVDEYPEPDGTGRNSPSATSNESVENPPTSIS